MPADGTPPTFKPEDFLPQEARFWLRAQWAAGIILVVGTPLMMAKLVFGLPGPDILLYQEPWGYAVALFYLCLGAWLIWKSYRMEILFYELTS